MNEPQDKIALFFTQFFLSFSFFSPLHRLVLVKNDNHVMNRKKKSTKIRFQVFQCCFFFIHSFIESKKKIYRNCLFSFLSLFITLKTRLKLLWLVTFRPEDEEKWGEKIYKEMRPSTFRLSWCARNPCHAWLFKLLSIVSFCCQSQSQIIWEKSILLVNVKNGWIGDMCVDMKIHFCLL